MAGSMQMVAALSSFLLSNTKERLIADRDALVFRHSFFL